MNSLVIRGSHQFLELSQDPCFKAIFLLFPFHGNHNFNSRNKTNDMHNLYIAIHIQSFINLKLHGFKVIAGSRFSGRAYRQMKGKPIVSSGVSHRQGTQKIYVLLYSFVLSEQNYKKKCINYVKIETSVVTNVSANADHVVYWSKFKQERKSVGQGQSLLNTKTCIKLP